MKCLLEAFGSSKELHIVIVQKEEFQLEYERDRVKAEQKLTIRKSRSVLFTHKMTGDTVVKMERTRTETDSPLGRDFRIKNEPSQSRGFSPARRIKSEMNLSVSKKLQQAADGKRSFSQRQSSSPHEE